MNQCIKHLFVCMEVLKVNALGVLNPEPFLQHLGGQRKVEDRVALKQRFECSPESLTV